MVDVQKAESDPAHSILASVYGGCSPVRVVLSQDSSSPGLLAVQTIAS